MFSYSQKMWASTGRRGEKHQVRPPGGVPTFARGSGPQVQGRADRWCKGTTKPPLLSGKKRTARPMHTSSGKGTVYTGRLWAKAPTIHTIPGATVPLCVGGWIEKGSREPSDLGRFSRGLETLRTPPQPLSAIEACLVDKRPIQRQISSTWPKHFPTGTPENTGCVNAKSLGCVNLVG